MTTDMKHLSLTALGATHIAGGQAERRADVFFVESKTSTTLVLRRQWLFGEGEEVADGEQLGRRRMAARTCLADLSSSKVVTQAGQRKANRELVLRRSMVARTSVAPSQHRWDDLPAPLRVTSVDTLARQLAERAPKLLRPRRLADDLRVVAIGEVQEVHYAAGEQQLSALVSDAEGGAFLIRLMHRDPAPGALDLLALALSGERGAPRYVSGMVHRTAAGVVVDPIAVLCDDLHVLDLAPESIVHPMAQQIPRANISPSAEALRQASELLVEGAHRGLRYVSAAYSERLKSVAGLLSRIGLNRTGGRVAKLPAALLAAQASGDVSSEAIAVGAWVDALLRIRLAEEVI